MNVLESIDAEYRRYKSLAEAAIAQVRDAELAAEGPGGTNSIAVMVWHLAGNLTSRFTDFLETDGEKPWRHRDTEFEAREVARDVLMEKWEQGWSVLFAALAALEPHDLERTVTIRRQPLAVVEALHRSLAHAAYHVGQIVLRARELRGEGWSFLSIPPGASAAYAAAPDRERAADHAAALRGMPPSDDEEASP